jgi:CRP-like cAMP-binding protein
MIMKTALAADREGLAAALRHFVPIDSEAGRSIVSAFVARKLSTGARLYPIGSVCTGVAFVSAGLLVSRSLSGGGDAISDVFSEGEFATDYVSFLTGQPSTVDIVALEPCQLLWLRHPDLQRLYAEVPLAERLGRLLAEAQFMAVVDRTSALLTQSPAERYRTLVARRPDLTNRVPQYLLARWLGVTPESLSRIRARVGRAQRMPTAMTARVPSKSKAPSPKGGGPKLPRAPREKP